jgi:hypothetical protein
MSARTFTGEPLTPGVNVDRIDVEAGLEMAEHLGYTSNGNEVMVATYALQRHARGEEEGAERTWLGQFGRRSFTDWRAVLAVAMAAGEAAAK